jgi:hypothetical protein
MRLRRRCQLADKLAVGAVLRLAVGGGLAKVVDILSYGHSSTDDVGSTATAIR